MPSSSSSSSSMVQYYRIVCNAKNRMAMLHKKCMQIDANQARRKDRPSALRPKIHRPPAPRPPKPKTMCGSNYLHVAIKWQIIFWREMSSTDRQFGELTGTLDDEQTTRCNNYHACRRTENCGNRGGTFDTVLAGRERGEQREGNQPTRPWTMNHEHDDDGW